VRIYYYARNHEVGKKEGEILISAPHDKEFVFHDGTRAKNLSELVLKLEHITDHEFHQFVNHSKNDFANWTEHVLNDKHFADKLRELLSKNETIHLIKDKIEDTTVGNSIIKIPRIEDHSEHHVEHHEEHKEEHHVKHENEKTLEKLDSEKPTHEKHLPDHLPNHASSLEKEKESKEKKKEEKSEKVKTKHHVFQLFSKRELLEKKSEKIVTSEESKLLAEKELVEELEQDNRENALWVILYFALVLLIITLLVYKLFI
jgi:hypothetical protein